MSFAWSYFPIVISDIVRMQPWQIMIYIITASIVQAIVSPRWGKIIDKIGCRKALIIGFIPFGLIPLFFAFATSWYVLLVGQVVAGFGIAAGFSALQTYLINVAGKERTGYYYGTYQFTWGFVTFFGSMLGGYVLSRMILIMTLKEALFILLITISIMRFMGLSLISKLPEALEK